MPRRQLREVVSAAAAIDADSTSNRSLGRLGGLLFIATGLVVGATAPLTDGASIAVLELAAGMAILAGVVVLLVPWQRWRREALLVQTMGGLLLVTFAARQAPGAIKHYLTIYVAVFIFVGVSQRMAVTLALVPVAAAAFVVGTWGWADVATYADFFVTLAMAAVVAVLLSAFVGWYTRANERLRDLLEASRSMARVQGLVAITKLLEESCASFVDADAVFTFLVDETGSSRCTTVLPTPVGMPAALTIDLAADGGWLAEAAARGEVVETDDLTSDPREGARLMGAAHCRSALWIPLSGQAGQVGVVVLGWRRPRRALRPLAQKGIEILATEAGVVLERQRSADQVALEAETDALTGLLNRRAMDRRMQGLRPGDAVILLDLDEFKPINDVYGHAAGDQLLRGFATCMTDSCRSGDWCARIGGDEFVIVLPEGGHGGARGVLADLRQAWRATEPLTTFSAGASVHRIGEEPSQTLERADSALYEAKSRGRDQGQVFLGCNIGMEIEASSKAIR
jgi:diguanylate cyclase (GGDEF)-like protein